MSVASRREGHRYASLHTLPTRAKLRTPSPTLRTTHIIVLAALTPAAARPPRQGHTTGTHNARPLPPSHRPTKCRSALRTTPHLSDSRVCMHACYICAWACAVRAPDPTPRPNTARQLAVACPHVAGVVAQMRGVAVGSPHLSSRNSATEISQYLTCLSTPGAISGLDGLSEATANKLVYTGAAVLTDQAHARARWCGWSDQQAQPRPPAAPPVPSLPPAPTCFEVRLMAKRAPIRTSSRGRDCTLTARTCDASERTRIQMSALVSARIPYMRAELQLVVRWRVRRRRGWRRVL